MGIIGPRHCERRSREAIQERQGKELDLFVALLLAMTAENPLFA
jgi:hypothetical protein